MPPRKAPPPKRTAKPAAKAPPKTSKRSAPKEPPPPPPAKRRGANAPPPPPLRPLRSITELTVDEILREILAQVDPGTAAFTLRVDPREFERLLAEDEKLKSQLRIARAAADEYRATRIALAAPFAASELVELMKDSTPTDSVRIGAVQAVLSHAAAARKADLVAMPAKRVEWPRPGPLPVRLVEANPAAAPGPPTKSDDEES